MRHKNVEFRRAGIPDSNGHVTKNRSPEIVAWMPTGDPTYGKKEVCYTLCWFQQDKESWYIKTVGTSFTEYEDIEVLMNLAKYSLRILNAEKQFSEACH